MYYRFGLENFSPLWVFRIAAISKTKLKAFGNSTFFIKTTNNMPFDILISRSSVPFILDIYTAGMDNQHFQ